MLSIITSKKEITTKKGEAFIVLNVVSLRDGTTGVAFFTPQQYQDYKLDDRCVTPLKDLETVAKLVDIEYNQQGRVVHAGKVVR